MTDAHLFELIVGGVSIAINALAAFGFSMVRGRLRDKDEEIKRLYQRINEVETALYEEHKHGHTHTEAP